MMNNSTDKQQIKRTPRNPDPKELEELFGKGVEGPTKTKKTNNNGSMYLLLFLIIVLSGIIVWQYYTFKEVQNIKTDLDIIVVPSPVVIDEEESISLSVITPEENASLQTNNIELLAEVEGLTSITVKVFDDNGKELASKIIKTVEEKVLVDEILEITKEPSTPAGYVIVYPSTQEINSDNTIRRLIRFSNL